MNTNSQRYVNFAAAVVSATYTIEGLLGSTSQVYNKLGVRELRTIQGMHERENKYVKPKYESDGIITQENHRRVPIQGQGYQLKHNLPSRLGTKGKEVDYYIQPYKDDPNTVVHNAQQMFNKIKYPQDSGGNQLSHKDKKHFISLRTESLKPLFDNHESSTYHLYQRAIDIKKLGAKLNRSFKVNYTWPPKNNTKGDTKFQPSLWLQQIHNDVKTAEKIVNKNVTVAKEVKDVLKNKNRWQPPQQLKDITGGRVRMVKDVTKINSLLKYVLNQNLQIFDAVAKEKSNQLLKKKLEDIKIIYKNKYNEFINETGEHTVVGKEGAKRLARNAIDVSNHFTNKLLDFLGEHVKEREILKNIHKTFRTGTDQILKFACSNLSVCHRSDSGFIDFIIDVLMIILSVNDEKFVVACNILVKAAKSTDYTYVFGDNINKCIHKGILNIDSIPLIHKKAAVTIVKNIIVNRNMPLVINAVISPRSPFVNKTLAFKDIVNTLNDKVPNSDAYKTKWTNIQKATKEWARDNNTYIDESQKPALVAHLVDIVQHLDEDSQGVIKNRLETICK